MSPSSSSSPRAIGSGLSWKLRSNRGFTLIEVLVSALMIVLIGSAAATALIATSSASGDERFRSQADQLAAQDLARLQGLSDEQLNDFNQTHYTTLNNSTYKLVTTSTSQDTTGNSGCASTAAAYFKTTSTVSWTENSNTSQPQSVVEESLLSRPVAGDLRTQVEDQTGQGLAGASVTATSGSNTQTATTDSTGCVLFAGLTSGTWTVNVADSGYEDQNQNPSPLTSTATVNSSGVAAPSTNPFYLGLPGSIVGTFSGPSGTTATAEADALSWSGSGFNGSGLGVIPINAPSAPGPASTAFTATSLFPFDSVTQPATPNYTGNYAVWGGRCPQQKPPSNLTLANVSPGAVYQAQAVQEPLLSLGSVKYNGGAVKPAHVKLTFQSTTGTSCTDTWYATVTSATSMPSTGWLANPGQPYSTSTAGTLTVCADYIVPNTTTTYDGTTTTTNSNFAPTGTSVSAITLSTKNGKC